MRYYRQQVKPVMGPQEEIPMSVFWAPLLQPPGDFTPSVHGVSAVWPARRIAEDALEHSFTPEELAVDEVGFQFYTYATPGSPDSVEYLYYCLEFVGLAPQD